MSRTYAPRNPLSLAIMAGCLLLGALAGLLVAKSSPVEYTAKCATYATIEGAKNSTDLQSMSGFVSGRAASYAGLAATGIVLQPVIDELKLDSTVAELAPKVAAAVDPETVVIQVQVVADEAERSSRIANAVCKQLGKAVAGLDRSADGSMSVKLTQVQTATAPSAPNNPSLTVNTLIGALAGLAVGYGMAVLLSSGTGYRPSRASR